MIKPFSLEGETALITGGGTGIGFGIATCFVQAGARVVLVGRREVVLKSAAEKLGDAASWEVHDVANTDESEALVQRVTQRAGNVSILVNNAGNYLKKPAHQITPDEFDSILKTHVLGAFSLSRAVLPDMMERKHGNILFTASMASLFGIPYILPYATAKSAYLGLVRTLATEVSPHGVRVNAVAPGWIESDIVRQAFADDPQRAEKVLGRTPMNRFGEAEEIGWAATFLCSPAASFITGVVLPVDGGISIGF